MTATPIHHAYVLSYAALKDTFAQCDSARQILVYRDEAKDGTALALPITGMMKSDPLSVLALGNPGPCILYKPDLYEMIGHSIKMQIGYTPEFKGRKGYILIAPEHGHVRAIAVKEERSPLQREGILAALAEDNGTTHFPTLSKGWALLTAPAQLSPVLGRVPRPAPTKAATAPAGPAVSAQQFNNIPR